MPGEVGDSWSTGVRAASFGAHTYLGFIANDAVYIATHQDGSAWRTPNGRLRGCCIQCFCSSPTETLKPTHTLAQLAFAIFYAAWRNVFTIIDDDDNDND